MNKENNINDFFEELLNFLKGDECTFPEFFPMFESNISDLKLLFNDISKPPNLEPKILEILNVIEELYLEHKLNKKNIDMILQYLLLIFNTNSNFIKSEFLTKRVTLLDRCFNNLLTSIDAISVMRNMIVKMKQYQKYGMPSIELSKLYVESME